jgi:hypothetical protein
MPDITFTIEGKPYSVTYGGSGTPTQGEIDDMEMGVRKKYGLKLPGTAPKTVPGAAFGSQDMTPKNVAYGSQNGVQQLNAQGQVVQPTGPAQVAYGSQDVSAKPSTAALRANETPTQTLQRIQNRIQQDQASQAETATRNQGALRTSARTPLGIPVAPEPATDRRTRLIQEGSALMAQMKKKPTKQGAMRLAQIQQALHEIESNRQNAEAIKASGWGQPPQSPLDKISQGLSDSAHAVMGAVGAAGKLPSDIIANDKIVDVNSVDPVDINTPGISRGTKAAISKYKSAPDVTIGGGVNPSVYTDTPAGRLSDFAQGLGAYGIPVLGQAGMVAQGVDIAQQLAKDPKNAIGTLATSMNVLDGNITADERAMRAVNLIMAVAGGLHAKKFIDDTMLTRDLTNRFLMTPEQAKTVVDLARERIGVQNGTIQNFLKQAGGGDVRAGAKRIVGQMSADMLAKGKPETVAGAKRVLGTVQNPNTTVDTNARDAKVANTLRGQTVDTQGFGNELPGVGKQRVAKPVLKKVEGAETPATKPVVEPTPETPPTTPPVAEVPPVTETSPVTEPATETHPVAGTPSVTEAPPVTETPPTPDTPPVTPTEVPKPRQSRTMETGDALQRAWDNASRRSQKPGAGYSPFFDHNVQAALVDHAIAHIEDGVANVKDFVKSVTDQYGGLGADFVDAVKSHADDIWAAAQKRIAEPHSEAPQAEPATHAASNASTNASRTRVGLPEGEAADEPTVAAMNRKTQEFMSDFGLGEHEKVEKQKVQDWRNEAKATGATARAVEIAKKINDGTKQRLSDVETVAMAERAKELINESKSQGVTTERLGEISNDLTDIAKATKKAGSAWGREGIARRVEIALNTDKHMVRARAEIAYEKTVGRDLTDTERAEISKKADEAHAKWVEAEKRLKEVQAENEKLKAEVATPEARAKAKAQAEKVIDSMVKTTERRAAKAENRVIRKAAADNIMRKLGRAPIGSSPFHALAEIAPDLKAIAKSYISDGIITFQGVTDGVITTVKELTGHQLSENDVHRALGGLEDPEPQAQTLESQHMSRIRSLSYLSGRIEEVLSGEYTPPERRTVHDEVKALRRIYNDLLKEKGLVSGKGMTRERSLMNAIDRALHVLENGPAEKPVKRPDTKAESELRMQLEAIKKQVKEKYGGKPPKPDAEKIAKIESQLAKLARGEDISGKPRTPESAEVQAARKNLRVARSMADIDAKFKALKELHSTEPRKPGEKPDPKVAAYREMYRQEEIKNRAKVQAEMYKSAIGNPEMADRLLAKRQAKKYPADLLKAKSDARAAKQNLIDFQKSYQYKPFFDKLHDWSMSNSLLNVMSRQLDLAANATKLASKSVTSPLSSAIGRHLARKYGKDIIAPERNMISRDTMRAMNDFWPRWKQEMSDVWHSKDADSMHKFDYQGNAMDQGRFTKALHNASTIAGRAAGLTDAPFKDTYQSVVYGDMAAHRFPGDLAKQDAMVRQLQGTIDHGPLSDVDMAHMQTVAHEIALRETFNNENVISKAQSSLDRGLRQSIEGFVPGKGGKEVAAAASFALKVFTRFSKVIGNVAWERFLRSGAGILIGKGEVKMLKDVGLDDMQIRTISDHFAKGLTGTAMVALGYFMAQKGLVKTPVVTTKSSQYVDWGDTAQYGGLISPWLFGAQMWTAANDPQIKNRNNFAAQTMLDLIGDQPAVTGLKRATDLTDTRSAGKVGASIVSGLLIPSGLSDLARRLDAHNNPDVKNRKVENVVDAFKARIPGVRETLPDSGSSKVGLKGSSLSAPRM